MLIFLLTPIALAKTTISFWHSQSANHETVVALADSFNTSQDDFEVVPVYAGDYREAAIKLIGAVNSGTPPVLFDAEVTVFPRLVEEGLVLELTDLANELPSNLVGDLYPNIWAYGELAGKRFGLPWNMAVPVLFYNASVLRQRGVEVPTDWSEFELAVADLTSRQTRGFIDVSAAFIFEMMVMSRGGQIVTEDGLPNFDSPEAIAALSLLQRLAKERHSIIKSFGELDAALVDFVRTKGMMAFASIAFWPMGLRYAIAFEPGAAPVPRGEAPSGNHSVPLMEGQLVVLEGASAEERRGAFAFWEFLVEPENVQTWVEASFALPVRRSALPLLEAWYAEDPNRRAGLDQIEFATARPRVGAYAIWQSYLEEAIEKSLKRGLDPETTLNEAQRRAEEDR
ncbi:MAG: ABC transporter substrate-binding protein [Trueperaceae bacterium]|nr:MAG: ABC transporter substrate-binding protein [Trueperaceae bacterium]